MLVLPLITLSMYLPPIVVQHLSVGFHCRDYQTKDQCSQAQNQKELKMNKNIFANKFIFTSSSKFFLYFLSFNTLYTV